MSGSDSPTGPGHSPSPGPGAGPGGGVAGGGDVEAYLARFPRLARSVLQELRDLARAAVPQAAETMRWEAPAYVHPDGTVLFQLEGHHAHASVVFTPGVLAAFEDELVNHETGRESVKVFYGQPAPHDLLERMMLARWREAQDQGREPL